MEELSLTGSSDVTAAVTSDEPGSFEPSGALRSPWEEARRRR